MRFTPKARQATTFFFLLLATALLSLWGYGLANPEYVAFRHAEQWREQGEMARATQAYQQAIDLGLHSPDALLRLGESYLEQGDIAQAEKIVATLLEKEQSRATMMQAAGLYDAHGLPAQALELVLKAREQTPLQEREMTYLAALHRRNDQYAEALALYREMRTADPSSLAPTLGLAETLAWIGQLDRAETLCREILATRPEQRKARLLLARILSWNGREEEAILEYQTLLGERP